MSAPTWSAIRTHLRDPLAGSSYALILSTAVTSGLGFAFWVLAARWLPTEDVGIGVAVVSAVTLLANVATLGMVNGMVRFLPAADGSARRLIVAVYLVCGGTAAIAAAVFLLGQPLWAEPLGFLRAGPGPILLFCTAVVVWVLFVLQDQVLVGLGRTGWVPTQNAVYSIGKTAALPLVAALGVWAVFTATIVPAVLVVAATTVAVLTVADRRRADRVGTAVTAPLPVRRIIRFAVADHAAEMLWMSTADVLTLIVLHLAGADASAYYYMAFTIGYTVSLAVNNIGTAVIAEAARDPHRTGALARRAARFGTALVVPTVAVGVVVAPWALSVMGPEYAAQATTCLRLILLSAIPHIIVGVGVAVARVHQRMALVLGVYAFTVVATWVGAWALLPIMGVTGIGVVFLAVQVVLAVFLLATGNSGLGRRASRPAGADPVAADRPATPGPVHIGGR